MAEALILALLTVWLLGLAWLAFVLLRYDPED